MKWGSLPALAALIAVVWLQVEMSPESKERQGRQAMDRMDHAAAVHALQRAVQLDPKRITAWQGLAEAACENGQPDLSQSALEQVAKLEPAAAGPLCFRLGTAWMKRNLARPAIQALQLSVRVSRPAPPEPYRLLAQVYGIIGRRRGVSESLLELLKRKAVTQNDLIVLSSYNPVLNDPERLKLFQATAPNDKSLLILTVMKSLELNRVDTARQLLGEMVEAAPDDADAQGILGEVLAEFQPEKFLEWHRNLPSTVADDARVWSARGRWLQMRGEVAASLRCLQESLIREPENFGTAALLGQILKSVGEIELGQSFTNWARHQQRIADLSDRIREPGGEKLIAQMIDELEAVGRIWEAWGWCAAYLQVSPRGSSTIADKSRRLEQRLRPDLPRTDPDVLPGRTYDWQQKPLPDWNKLEKNQAGDLPTAPAAANADDIDSPIRFEDQAADVGLDFQYFTGKSQASGHKIYETMGAGVAVLDFDRDGWPDLYFPQGKRSPGEGEEGPSDVLYRNDRGQKYRSVRSLAGIHEVDYSQGVAVGDINQDGFPDLYIANLGRNRLYQNNGDGTFDDITEQAGIKEKSWTVSCGIADLNGDGWPELFDVNYVKGQELLTRTCYDRKQRPVVCRPTIYDPSLDTVIVNLGDGHFKEVREEAGLDLPLGRGLGLAIADYNDDDRLDLFIANDMSANYLLINATTGPGSTPQFRDEAFARGVALDRNGLTQACMGVACTDLNRDRIPDLFVTNFFQESNTLYLSQPGGLFQDETQRAGLREPSFNQLGFGTQFLDADCDGWADLAVGNGHIDEFDGEPYRMPLQFFRGHPDGRFVELSGRAGRLFEQQRLARGLAVLDWNRDGRCDFVATDLERPVLLAENKTETPNHALRLELVATRGDRDAIGAKLVINVSSGDQRYVQLTAGDGYESSNQRLIHLGVAETEVIDSLEIHWPSGVKNRHEKVSCRQGWKAIEGRPELISLPN